MRTPVRRSGRGCRGTHWTHSVSGLATRRGGTRRTATYDDDRWCRTAGAGLHAARLVGTSRHCSPLVDPEVRVSQSQHGPPGTEVSDLRNIVDRLDLLMSGPGSRAGRTGSSVRDEVISALEERVEALEGEVDELRTLVNHLMTIATWQAKVTATLVDDRADDADEDIAVTDAAPNGDAGPRYATAGTAVAAEQRHDGAGARSRRPPAAPATTLDDDIDDILGSDRGGSHHDAPPPDFGI